MGVLCMLVLSTSSEKLSAQVEGVRDGEDPGSRIRWTHGLMDLMDPENHDVLHQFANEIHV